MPDDVQMRVPGTGDESVESPLDDSITLSHSTDTGMDSVWFDYTWVSHAVMYKHSHSCMHPVDDSLQEDVTQEHSCDDNGSVQSTTASSTLDQIIDSFYDLVVMPQGHQPTVCSIVSHADKQTEARQIEVQTHQSTIIQRPSSSLLREIDHLKEENEVMKVHLSNELKKLQNENMVLKEKIKALELTARADAVNTSVRTDLPEGTTNLATPESCRPPSSSSDDSLDSALIKKFNKIPKSIKAFYFQMKDGDSNLPRFKDLPNDFKQNKRTKGTFSKRKAIYAYLEKYLMEHSGETDALLSEFESISSLQLYEKLKKISRPQN